MKMGKYYQLFRGSKPADNRVFNSKQEATWEMRKWNNEFVEYNQYIKAQKLDRKPIKPVRVKEINFSKRGNLDI